MHGSNPKKVKPHLTCELELGVVELGRPAVLAPLLFGAPLELLSPSPLGSPPKSECIEREGEVDIGAGGWGPPERNGQLSVTCNSSFMVPAPEFVSRNLLLKFE